MSLAAFFFGVPNARAEQFKKPAYYRSGELPSQVVTGDFNNDGNTDLAFADWLSNQLVVLLGNGDGTFQRPLVVSAPSPTCVAVGDLNGDGNLDIVVAESGGSGSGALAVYLGEGNGKFHVKATYGLGDYAGVVTVADFDGDGRLDVAAGDEGTGSKGVVRVFRGNGNGTLQKAATYKLGVWLGQLAASHLAEGCLVELVVTDHLNGPIVVLTRDVRGKFAELATYNAGG